MEAKAKWLSCVRFLALSLVVLLFSGLAACDQAPTPPPFRPYDEPEPFEPPDTTYMLDEARDSSVE